MRTFLFNEVATVIQCLITDVNFIIFVHRIFDTTIIGITYKTDIQISYGHLKFKKLELVEVLFDYQISLQVNRSKLVIEQLGDDVLCIYT